MSLKVTGIIKIPNAKGSSFDHGAFDPVSRRVFVAHTGRDCVDVIDHDSGKHIATLPGFAEAAGVVAADGIVLVTNRGAASMSWVDAQSLKTRAVFKTGRRPNGVAIVPQRRLAISASIGDESEVATLQVVALDTRKTYSVELPGRPRWCVTDAAAERVFLAIRDPSMVFVARLPDLSDVQHWKLSAHGAHGLDIDHRRGRLYVACDDANLIEVDTASGKETAQWPIAGPPDVTFVDPHTGIVHVAIGEPGVVQSVDPSNGASSQTATAEGAHTTALTPSLLYVFSPSHGGIVTLAEAHV